MALVTDGCGVVSMVSNMTAGLLDYHLGDVSDGLTPGQGDARVGTEDVSLLGAHYGIEDAEIVVSTIPDHYLKGIANRHILQLVRQLNPKALVVVTAETLASARELYAAGADYVSLPRLYAAADLLPALEKLVAGVTDRDREAFQAAVKQRHEIIP